MIREKKYSGFVTAELRLRDVVGLKKQQYSCLWQQILCIIALYSRVIVFFKVIFLCFELKTIKNNMKV